MISKGDIKEILLVLLLAAIAVSISAGAEYYFNEYISDTEEDSVKEQHVGWDSSYCRSSINMKTGGIQWDCRKLSTPKFIQLMRGSKVIARA